MNTRETIKEEIDGKQWKMIEQEYWLIITNRNGELQSIDKDWEWTNKTELPLTRSRCNPCMYDALRFQIFDTDDKDEAIYKMQALYRKWAEHANGKYPWQLTSFV